MNKRLRTIAARGKRGESFKAWLIMLPGLVLMTFFVWEPLLESVRMSLYKTENVELVLDSTVAGLVGEDRLSAVVVENKFTKERRTLDVSGLFVAVGILPRTELVQGQVELNEGGFIVTDKFMQTSVPGVFAAGDVRDTPLRQVVTACADGAVAATKAIEYVGMK